MKTEHLKEANLSQTIYRPLLPVMHPDKLVKGKYVDGERMCMTGWMLHTFLTGVYYVNAYKEFRCKMMDIMYEKYSEDHANTPEQRSKLWNETAESLGYKQSEDGDYYFYDGI